MDQMKDNNFCLLQGLGHSFLPTVLWWKAACELGCMFQLTWGATPDVWMQQGLWPLEGVSRNVSSLVAAEAEEGSPSCVCARLAILCFPVDSPACLLTAEKGSIISHCKWQFQLPGF